MFSLQRRQASAILTSVFDIIVHEESIVEQLDRDSSPRYLTKHPAMSQAASDAQGWPKALAGPARIA